MTYRDFTPRQISRLQKLGLDALEAYRRAYPLEIVNEEHWKRAWSKAFIAGVNFTEKKYSDTELFGKPKGETK